MGATAKGQPGGLAILDPAGALVPGRGSVFSRSNMPRLPVVDSAGDAHVPLADAVMTSVAIYLYKDDIVTSLSFQSGATAVGTPAHWWFALYDTAATPALIAQTADQLTAAWAANTVKTLALSAPYKVTVSGWYNASVMVDCTTVCSLVGAVGALAVPSGEPVLSQSSGSALAATAPATIATPTTKMFVPRVVVT